MFPDIPEVSNYGGQRGYLLNLVQQELQDLDFSDEEINGGGLKVVTTLDWATPSRQPRPSRSNGPTGTRSCMWRCPRSIRRTGALRAMVGGRDYTGGGPKDQVNFALAPTQVGSTMKAYAVAAGLDDGFTLRDTFDGNSPYTYPNGETVRNEGQSVVQPVWQLLRLGDLADGRHPAVRQHGVRRPDLTDGERPAEGRRRRRRGRRPPRLPRPRAQPRRRPRQRHDPQRRDGRGLRDLRAERRPPRLVRHRGGERSQRAALRAQASRRPGVHPGGGEQRDVRARAGRRRRHRRRGAGPRAAGRRQDRHGDLGTADDQYVSSSWFVGYTPQLSTAITYTRGDGNDSLEGYLEPFYGANYPTQTWTAFMELALAGQPVRNFPDPAELHGENPTYSPPPTTSAPTTHDADDHAPPPRRRPPTTTSSRRPPLSRRRHLNRRRRPTSTSVRRRDAPTQRGGTDAGRPTGGDPGTRLSTSDSGSVNVDEAPWLRAIPTTRTSATSSRRRSPTRWRVRRRPGSGDRSAGTTSRAPGGGRRCASRWSSLPCASASASCRSPRAWSPTIGCRPSPRPSPTCATPTSSTCISVGVWPKGCCPTSRSRRWPPACHRRARHRPAARHRARRPGRHRRRRGRRGGRLPRQQRRAGHDPPGPATGRGRRRHHGFLAALPTVLDTAKEASMVRHFLRDDDLSPAEQADVLDLADRMKADRLGFPRPARESRSPPSSRRTPPAPACRSRSASASSAASRSWSTGAPCSSAARRPSRTPRGCCRATSTPWCGGPSRRPG